MTNKQGIKIPIDKVLKKRNKTLFLTVAAFTSLLIGGIGATIATTLINDSQNNSISQVKNDNKIIENDAADFENLTIRTNPINGFDNLDVYDTNDVLTGNKLVLVTDTTNLTNQYGIALVDSNMNFISKWLIPNDSKYSLNYTTNIIPGNDSNTFFVLAGISNLAKALNNVYTNYDPTKTNYTEIVTANMSNAASIKIFKIVLNQNSLILDNDNPVYDFHYPKFEDKPTYEGGLKFFTKSGLFGNFKRQQTSYAGDSTAVTMGYYQYLQYGQLFQYNYNNKSDDKDQFAMISSYLGVDANLGNMYAFYSDTTKTIAPTISYNNYFFNDVLAPLIKDNTSSTPTPYIPKNGITKTSYKIISPNGNIITAPDEDQLTIDTAMSIAFMMDFTSEIIPYNYEYTIGMSGTSIYLGHTTYGILPGWFIFRPNLGSDWLSYGHLYNNSNYVTGNSNWATTIGTKYDKGTHTYYTMQAYLLLPYYEDFIHYSMLTYNYFNIDYTEYGSSFTKAIYNTNTVTLVKYDDQIWNQNFSMITLDELNQVYAFTTNTSQVGLFIKNIGQMLMTNSLSYDFKGSIRSFNYDKELQILNIITNKNIYSMTIDWEDWKSEDNWTQNVNTKILINNLSYVDYLFSRKILDSSYIFNPDNKGNLNGIIIQINAPNKSNNQIYSIQTLTNDNDRKVIATISIFDVGYQITKSDTEFTQLERNVSIATIASTYDSDRLKTLFVNKARVEGTDLVSQISLIVTNANKTNIGINEVIKYKNTQTLLGFTIKNSDTTTALSNPDSRNWISSYNNVFLTSLQSIAWYVEPDQVMNEPTLNTSSVSDMLNMYNSDFQKFQDTYFDLIITRIDNKQDNISYKLKIFAFDIDVNTITFQIVAVYPQSEVIIQPGNQTANANASFTYNGVFPASITNTSIMYIIIIVSVIVGLAIILGLAIGIPSHKHRKSMQNQIKLSNKKIDTLTLGIGSIFKQITDKYENDKTNSLLENKYSQKKPKVVKLIKPVNAPINRNTTLSNTIKRPPIKPIYKSPTQFSNSSDLKPNKVIKPTSYTKTK